MSNKIKRAGIIPYFLRNEEITFIFGQDTKHLTLTDFGGFIKKGETSVCCALRELKEESLSCFSGITENDINESFYINEDDIIIYFVCIEFNMKETEECFQNNLCKVISPEVNKLVYLNKDSLREVINYSTESQKDLYRLRNIPIIYSKILNIIKIMFKILIEKK